MDELLQLLIKEFSLDIALIQNPPQQRQAALRAKL